MMPFFYMPACCACPVPHTVISTKQSENIKEFALDRMDFFWVKILMNIGFEHFFLFADMQFFLQQLKF